MEVIVDLDGPILDVAVRHYAVYCGIADDLAFATLSFDEYWEKKREPLGAARILESTGARALYDAFAERWLQQIELDAYLSMDALQPGATETLDRWRARGYRLVLATMRQDPDALARQLAGLDLDRRFETVVVCDRLTGGAGKAASVAAAAGAAETASCWIGDTEVDIEAARERGSTAWALSCGLRAAPYLAARNPDRLCEYLSDVEPEGEGR